MKFIISEALVEQMRHSFLILLKLRGLPLWLETPEIKFREYSVEKLRVEYKIGEIVRYRCLTMRQIWNLIDPFNSILERIVQSFVKQLKGTHK